MSNLQGVRACVFDAFGTLFDVASAVNRYPDIPDEKRPVLAGIWRDKQLQYTWLRSMQNRYANFEQVTADALDFALETTELATPARRSGLVALYRTLAAFTEAPSALKKIKDHGLQTAILSNGTHAMLAAIVEGAQLSNRLDHILSVDDLGVFKPDARVYQLAVDRLGVPSKSICFVSSNGWDAYGASAFGFRVVWCNRYNQCPERLPGAPDYVIKTLTDLADLF